MSESEWLASQFEQHRRQLRAMAYRMLGSSAEADDAVQEAWLRLARQDATAIDNLGGWLTTVVARVCLNMLQSRRTRAEQPLDEQAVDVGAEPEQQAEQADAVGAALLVVLETLSPAERLAFVLHDMFGVPFEEIAPVVERSPAATRQLASRARRRVRGAGQADADLARRRAVVEAFLAASREGDFEALLELLDPQIVLRADRVAVALAAAHQDDGAPPLQPEVRGVAAVARAFLGRATGARPALVDGVPGAAWAPGNVLRAVFAMSVAGDKITSIEVVVDPVRIRELHVELLA